MKYKKVLSLILTLAALGSAASGAAVFASENDAAVYDCSMENAFVKLSVEQDKTQGEYLRYGLDTVKGQLSNDNDDNKNLTYANFFSGFTTLNINGQNYVYGRGTDESEPYFDASDRCHVSSQKFGDVVIEQKLSLAEGFTPGCDDMLKVSYTVLDASENDRIGIRVLIDPMISDDDKAKLRTGKTDILKEAVFSNENIPSHWAADFSGSQDISAYGKVNSGENAPDSLIFANWDSLYDSVWNFSPDIDKEISDAACALKWEPEDNAAGKEYCAYYGVKNSALADEA
ncbi:MAG: hypothetical protein Q4F95_16225, partial [Oscillospiraceae bacterium]|nr:hypothetical protein [Oscillospiraceae bacterium]